VASAHPGAKVTVKHTKQYLNMEESLKETPELLDTLIDAARAHGVEPVFRPIRGGTDGSRLTEMGRPTPNMWTGGHNFHSRTEWASLEQMEKALEVLVDVVERWRKGTI
jgi:tripeptide aminopeptidase